VAPEIKAELVENIRKIETDIREKIDVLSAFVKVLAQEHAPDVNDPAGLLTDFGLEPEKVKDG